MFLLHSKVFLKILKDIKYLNNGYYTIRSYADGYALTIANNNKKAGGNVTYTSYNESISQQWAILKNNDGTYTVVSGDSLWSIAKKFDTTVNEIKRLNNLSNNLLKVRAYFIFFRKNHF